MGMCPLLLLSFLFLLFLSFLNISLYLLRMLFLPCNHGRGVQGYSRSHNAYNPCFCSTRNPHSCWFISCRGGSGLLV
ncbi:hypothetical protein ACB092_09G020000 [Castanea dentata]